jgi:hypothetical protein
MFEHEDAAGHDKKYKYPKSYPLIARKRSIARSKDCKARP